MGRGTEVLARVVVTVRAAASWCWWLGVLAAVAGIFVPGVLGRAVGLFGGAGLFVIAAAVAALVRQRRYERLAQAATRAGKAVVLQNRQVTAREWTRRRRWWLLAAFLAAVGTSAVAPGACGLLLAGVGAGLWAKTVRLGRWEREHQVLLWVRPDGARSHGPAGPQVRAYRTTGPAAGDARPGGARRRSVSPAAR